MVAGATGVTLLMGLELFAWARLAPESAAAPVGLMVIQTRAGHTEPWVLTTAVAPSSADFDIPVVDVPLPASSPAGEMSKSNSPAGKPPVEAPVPSVTIPTGHHQMTFDNRPLRKARTLRMLVTAYSPDERSCGIYADGITASGYSVWTNGMKLVAADTKVLPMKSILTIPGYNGGRPVPVLDRGGAIKGNRLDVLYPTHELALQWGKKWLDVDVWEYAD